MIHMHVQSWRRGSPQHHAGVVLLFIPVASRSKPFPSISNCCLEPRSCSISFYGDATQFVFPRLLPTGWCPCYTLVCSNISSSEYGYGAAVELQSSNGVPGVQHIKAPSILRWGVIYTPQRTSRAGQLHGSEKASQAPRSLSKQPIAADTLAWNYDMTDLPQLPEGSWPPA